MNNSNEHTMICINRTVRTDAVWTVAQGTAAANTAKDETDISTKHCIAIYTNHIRHIAAGITNSIATKAVARTATPTETAAAIPAAETEGEDAGGRGRGRVGINDADRDVHTMYKDLFHDIGQTARISAFRRIRAAHKERVITPISPQIPASTAQMQWNIR